MSLTPEDPIVPSPPAFRQIHTEEAIKRAKEHGPRQHKLIPNTAVETLRQWDEYRAEQQAKYREMTPKEQRAYMFEQIGIPTNDADFKALIATLPDLDARDAAIAKARADREAAAAEKARKENKWHRKILRKVKAIFRLK